MKNISAQKKEHRIRAWNSVPVYDMNSHHSEAPAPYVHTGNEFT